MSKEFDVRVWIIPENRYADNKHDEIHYQRWGDLKSGEWYVATAKDDIYEEEDIIVEQDTGLKDKNGKKVHKGDIIRLYDKIYTIIWSDAYYSFRAKGETESYWLDKNKACCEVIGNIHENPELLEGEK